MTITYATLGPLRARVDIQRHNANRTDSLLPVQDMLAIGGRTFRHINDAPHESVREI